MLENIAKIFNFEQKVMSLPKVKNSDVCRKTSKVLFDRKLCSFLLSLFGALKYDLTK